MSREMLAELARVWENLDGDPTCRAVVVTGAGGAFCAGGDVKAMNEANQAGTGRAAEGADIDGRVASTIAHHLIDN